MNRTPAGNGLLLLSIIPPIGGDGQLDTSRHLDASDLSGLKKAWTAGAGGNT